MAYENITLRRQTDFPFSNVTMVDGYFYMVDEGQDALIVKTDDGTQAYSYPLDTTITETIKSLEHDGRNFWSLENPGAGTITIRRWNFENYVLKLRDTFTLTGGGHTYDSVAFTVQHYHLRFSGNEAAGQSALSVSTDGKFTLNSQLTSGMTAFLGPNSSGESEEISVNSATSDTINVNGTTTYAYSTNDPISFYNRIWVFNDYDGTDNSSGGLYKINAYTGSYMTHTAGGEYQDVNSCTFFDMYDVFGNGTNSICYVKATNLIFLDPDDLTDSHGSMTMDNLEDDQANVIPIYDLTMEGSNVYRLQRKATYYGTTYTFSDDTFNYQLSTLDAFITSISLRADPAILPANGVNTSTITAIVKDQFNEPIASKLVTFTDDDPNGAITGSNPANTNSEGVATTTYTAGTTAREVKITATAQQG
jgi:hypothetical protein